MSMIKVAAPLPKVDKMCFGELVARTLHGLRVNGLMGMPMERIHEVARQNGHDPSKLLNRVMRKRRARTEYRDSRRWLVLNNRAL